MYFTYVVRPSDAPEGRGPQFKPFWDALISANLRSGFAIHLACICCLAVISAAGGDYFGIARMLGGVGSQNMELTSVLFFCLLAIDGAVLLLSFRNMADDDSCIKQSRGFRAGIKFLNLAALLDIVSWMLTAMSVFMMGSFSGNQWEKKLDGSNMYFIAARMLHVTALFAYAGAVFCLEIFHSKGTAEFWGWVIASMLKLSAIAEFLVVCTGSAALDVLFTVGYIATLSLCFIWALTFEPIVNRADDDVKMTQSAIRNEFYRSKNSMAYYGPPIIDGSEQVQQNLL